MLDEKLVEELRAKHGSAVRIRIPETEFDAEVEVVAKRPPRVEWKRFRTMLFDDAQKPDALETLAKACVLHPSAVEFTALLNERPALAEVIGSKLSELAGGGKDAEAKKL